MEETESLPPAVGRVLDEVVTGAREAFGSDLTSVVLFGSAAEGRLRATSDVNVLFVLRRFDPAAAVRVAPALRAARAAARVEPMFVLESEIPDAADDFAVKFADVARRHRVLHGTDPFAGLRTDRARLLSRLDQVLLNLTMRLRARLAVDAEREDRLAFALADAVGPLRASACALREAKGAPPLPPKEALQSLLEADEPGRGLAERLSALHRGEALAEGETAATFSEVLALSARMRGDARSLRGG